MNDFNFGENLRIIRQAKGFSQEVMAERLGISQTKYSKIEKSAKVPAPAMVKKMCVILEVEPQVLLSGRKLEDLVPKVTFRDKAKDILDTWEGIFFYWILQIPFVDAVYFMANGFCKGFDVTEEVTASVRFAAGFVAFVVSICFFIRLKWGKN